MSTLIDALKGLQSEMHADTDLVTLVWEKRLSEIIAEHERSESAVKCKCGNPAEADHTCPYKVEIHDNTESLCNCCGDCRHNCAMDI